MLHNRLYTFYVLELVLWDFSFDFATICHFLITLIFCWCCCCCCYCWWFCLDEKRKHIYFLLENYMATIIIINGFNGSHISKWRFFFCFIQSMFRYRLTYFIFIFYRVSLKLSITIRTIWFISSNSRKELHFFFSAVARSTLMQAHKLDYHKLTNICQKPNECIKANSWQYMCNMKFKNRHR